MTTTPVPPPPTEQDGSPVPRSAAAERKRRLAWLAGGTFAVVTLGAWMWALFVYDPGLLVDELADRSFPTAAEPVCEAAVAEIGELPPAETADDPQERGEVVTRANAILAEMLVELRAVAPTEPPVAAEAVGEWLDDWDTHLEDRQGYAERLATGEDARFTETTKGSRQVSRAIDGFAQVNRMPSCETPGDVG